MNTFYANVIDLHQWKQNWRRTIVLGFIYLFGSGLAYFGFFLVIDFLVKSIYGETSAEGILIPAMIAGVFYSPLAIITIMEFRKRYRKGDMYMDQKKIHVHSRNITDTFSANQISNLDFNHRFNAYRRTEKDNPQVFRVPVHPTIIFDANGEHHEFVVEITTRSQLRDFESMVFYWRENYSEKFA